LADPFGVTATEEQLLRKTPPRSIRAFDAAITAPRWGYDSVEEYYRCASPLVHLLDPKARRRLPPTLLLQALDDPWVPARAAQELQRSIGALNQSDAAEPLSILLTARGGHNGFHASGDSLTAGSWSDRLANAWYHQLL
jgi:predicted alpha/beta-fold hydrolase